MNPVSARIYKDIQNKYAAEFLDKVLFKGGVATLGAGAVAGAGAELWNASTGSDWDINAGDLARAAAVLGALGYSGARGLDAILTGPVQMERFGRFAMGPGVKDPGINFGYHYTPKGTPARPDVMPNPAM